MTAHIGRDGEMDIEDIKSNVCALLLATLIVNYLTFLTTLLWYYVIAGIGD